MTSASLPPSTQPSVPRPVPPSDRRVLLYSRPGCHLCDDAREVVRAVCEQEGAAWDEVDIEADLTGGLESQYGDYVPVVLVDGVQQGFWRVDGARLARALGR